MTNNNTAVNNSSSELIRANRVSVKPLGDCFIADFYRTHKKLKTINSSDIPADKWQKHDPLLKETTKLQIREDFRSYCISEAKTFGIEYDPVDRRTDANKRASSYQTDDVLISDTITMIEQDIATFINKMPDFNMVERYDISVDSINPLYQTAKGVSLDKLGIEDGKYVSNGKWAWATIDVMVTLFTTVKDENGQAVEIYQPINMQLASGQLKKMHITQTLWNTEIHKSMIEAKIITEKVIVVDEVSKPAGKNKSTKKGDK